MTFNPDHIFHELEDSAEAMVAAQENARLLEELKKPRLAALTLDEMAVCKSRVEAETRALASDEYAAYVKGMVAAGRLYERARAKYHNQRVLAELRRSQESTARALAHGR